MIRPLADRIERVRIDLVTEPVFLGHEQAPGMPDRRGVSDRAVDAIDTRIVGERITIAAEEGASRFAFGLVAIGLHETDIEIDRAAFDVETADHSVGVE